MPKSKNRNAYMRAYLKKRRDAGLEPDRREYFRLRRQKLKQSPDRFAATGKVIAANREDDQ